MDIPKGNVAVLVALAVKADPTNPIVQYYQGRLKNAPPRYNVQPETVLEWSTYMLDKYCTARDCARHFGVPPALVSYHVSGHLKRIDPAMARRLARRSEMG